MDYYSVIKRKKLVIHLAYNITEIAKPLCQMKEVRHKRLHIE